MGRGRFTGGQTVVAGQAACAIDQGGRGHRDQVGAGNILAVEAAGGGGGDRLTADQASGDGQRGRGRGGAVIHLVRGAGGGSQRLGRNGGRCRALYVQAVVGVVERHAAKRHAGRTCYVFAVVGAGGGAGDGHHVTGVGFAVRSGARSSSFGCGQGGSATDHCGGGGVIHPAGGYGEAAHA